MTAAYPYSCQTGTYTIEQLGGEDCAKCGKPFQPGETSRPVEQIAEWQLFAHVECPTALTLHGIEITASVAANALFLGDAGDLALSDDDALTVIDRALTARDDDLTRCVAEVCGEIGDHPECAGPRWCRCVVRAYRLIGTVA